MSEPIKIIFASKSLEDCLLALQEARLKKERLEAELAECQATIEAARAAMEKAVDDMGL